MTKCSIEDCEEICTYKIFDTCHYHTTLLIIETSNEIALEAFPEMNGLPPKEPKSEYAKWVRKVSGADDD